MVRWSVLGPLAHGATLSKHPVAQHAYVHHVINIISIKPAILILQSRSISSTTTLDAAVATWMCLTRPDTLAYTFASAVHKPIQSSQDA